MAMNKQRRSSNIANIFSYDDAGNIVIKDYGQVTRYSWNGLIHGFVGPLSVSSVSAATTDTDRFLVSDGGVLKYRTGVELLSDIGGVPSTRTLTINGTTQDLSADRSFTIPSNNIYNSDGTLTGNRIVTVDDKQLVFRSNPSTLQNYTFTIGTPTGVPPSTWPASVVFEGEYLMNTANSEPYNTRVWGRNQSASARSFYVNQVFADITSESTGGTNMYNQLFLTRRGSPLDTSTTATSFMRGVWSEIGHRYGGASATLATITTTNQDAYYASNINNTGNITNAIGYYAQNQTGYAGTPYTTNITNYYGFYQFTILQDSKSTITNHYGVFLNTPTIATGGIITNRWGIYAPDIASRHYFNGNVLLGTTTDAGYKLDVQGTARVSDTLTVSSGSSNGALVVQQNSLGFAAQVVNRANTTNIIGQIAFVDLKTGVGSRGFGLGIGRSADPQWTNGDFIFAYYTGTGTWQQSAKIFNASGNWAIENGTATSDIASAILQVNSTTKGFLAPRMTTVERDAIVTPATGLQIYNTTTLQQNIYNGTSWVGTGSVSGSGADGQVAYWNGTNSQTGSSDLIYNNTNKSFQLGNSTNSNSTRGLYLTQTTADGAGNLFVFQKSRGGVITSGTTIGVVDGEGFDGAAYQKSSRILFATSGTISSGIVPGTISFFTANASGVLTSRTTINESGLLSNVGNFQNNGNALLGGSTDGGQRLQVYGDAFIKGSGATDATFGLQVQNSAGTNIFRVRNDSYVMLNGDLWIDNDFRRIYAGATRNSVSRTSTGTSTIFYNALQLAATNSAWSFLSDQTYTLTLGDISGLNVRNTFAPTSGTATFNHLVLDTRINQTGGANGITRGIYVAPSITAAADWRSIEWSNNSGWGLYGDGSANNFLRGALGIGTTSALSFININLARRIGGASFAIGIVNQGQVQSDVTNTAHYFSTEANTQAAAFTVANIFHYNAQQTTIGLGSSVINQYGFAANFTLVGATNNYGFYGNIPNGANRWNLYMAGTADNYMAGGLAIGDTTVLTGHNMRIFKSVGGAASSYGFANQTTFLSTVTTTGHGFSTLLSTQATAFNMSFLYHYRAQVSSLGAGSTIGTQVGFIADGTIIGATNNYAFQGAIANGTGNWNLYMSGTADNYLAGKLLIGTTSVSTFALDVVGDTRIKGSGATVATTALTVQNSAGLPIFVALNNRTTYFSSSSGYDGTVEINTPANRLAKIGFFEFTAGSNANWTGTGIRVDGANRCVTLGLSGANTTDNNALIVSMGGSGGQGFSLRTSGIIEGALFDSFTFAPTSGTATFAQFVLRGTINQTGGANGITRGLYVNPTLTAAADWRSIEWSNNSGWGLYGAGTAPNFLGGNTTINGTLQVGTTNTWETYIYSRTSISGILLRANYGVAAQMDLTFDVNGVLNMTGVVGFSTANVIGTTTLQTNGNVQLNGNNKAVYWVNVTDQFIVGMSGQNYVIRANSGSLTSGGSLVSTSFFTGNTTFGGSVDAGYKIDVQGTSRFSDKLSVIATATTNDVALFRSVEPYITIEAVGASNPASIFFRPSTSAQNATIQNRTGGGIDLYTGITPSLSLAIKSSGAVVTSSTLGLNGVEDSVKSGKYTPTLTNSTNVASSAVNDNVFKYIRVGSTVHVSGWVTITATASNTLTELELSLPIASNITSNEDVSGVANTLSGGYGQVRENATNNTAKMYVQPTSTSNLVWYLEFSYVII